MAEELQDAAYILPRVIVTATVINGALMWIMAITICYTIGNVSEGQ
jgi:choline transport protein